MKRLNKIKWISMGTAVCLIITALVIPALAVSFSKTAELHYDDIKIKLNGATVTPKDINGNAVDPFVIDGTTYLPVRAIGGALGIGVDWDESTNTVLLTDTSTTGNVSGIHATSVAKGLRVISEYTWGNEYANYVAIIVQNNSGIKVQPRIQLTLKNSKGEIIGAKNSDAYAFGDGSTMTFLFQNEDAFSDYNYVITAGEEKYYNDCVSSLLLKVNKTDKKAILEIKNSGVFPARFVEFTALFLQNGKVVDYDKGFCIGENSEIKPGDTEYAEAQSNKPFDAVEVYLTGRSEK